MKQKIYKTLAKFALRLHNFSYKLASRFAIRTEGGLHPKHRLMNYHKFFVDNIEASDRVLDVGCGNGALAYDVAKKAQKVVGVDLNKENIKIAKENYSAPNIEYLVGDATKGLPNQKFDVIILSNVLEHIENRIEFLQKIKDLAPKILIRVPMINRDWITLYKKELEIEWRLDKTLILNTL
ncbi:MAG TPA: class I SAM-dependent methyltransferase [Candidatus Atribacteria bacterium]|nr:class I SAM-dependent methyltransferase [Candidatus Atribacteria bacterium]